MLFMSCFCHAFAALWSLEGKGLTSWLLFVMFVMILLLPVWYPGTGVVLNYIDSRSLLPFLLLCIYTVVVLFTCSTQVHVCLI